MNSGSTPWRNIRRIMRVKGILFLSFVFAGLAWGQAAETVADPFTCFVQFTPPKYPASARQARVQSTVEVSFNVSSESRARDVVHNGHPMLVPAVDAAVKSALYSAKCAGKVIKLRFAFELKEPPGESASYSVREEPDTIRIIDRAGPLMP